MSEHLFEDGETVLIGGKVSTVNHWSFIPRLNRFTYTIKEDPSTFYFEGELSKCKKSCDDCFDCDFGQTSDTITLKRIYSTHCQVCGRPHNSPAIVWFVPDDNSLICHRCAVESGLKHEPRIYKEGE